jgi:hypothetical protein
VKTPGSRLGSRLAHTRVETEVADRADRRWEGELSSSALGRAALAPTKNETEPDQRKTHDDGPKQ